MLYNINPSLWGPHCWKFLHFVTLSYPENPTEEDKTKVKNFIFCLKNILPCEKCRHHFHINLNKYPITDKVLSSRYNLINWLLNIHNEVNSKNGKKMYTYQDLLKEYDLENNNENYNVEIATIALLVLLVIIVAIYMIKFR